MKLYAWLALLALAPLAPPADARPAASVPITTPLTIRTAHGRQRFRVEVARTEEEQARGLMFRTSLAAQGGMIFPMVPPRLATFWMKNTLIPLDMIFIRPDGTIARIAENTAPQSLGRTGRGGARDRRRRRQGAGNRRGRPCRLGTTLSGRLRRPGDRR